MMTIIAFIIAYLLGSISSAVVVCKLANLPDPRTQGSGNPGASNVLRMAGKTYAAMTLIGDMLKGYVAVVIALVLGVHGWLLGLVALVAVLGHMYPIFFKFQGGKGVATAIGSMLGLSLIIGLIAAVIWIALVAIFRYASLASLAACIIAPFVSLVIFPPYFLGLALIAVIVAWRHRENIDRLRNGSEKKLTFDK